MRDFKRSNLELPGRKIATAWSDRRWKSWALVIVIIVSSVSILCSNAAQAAISLRASSSGSVSNQVKLRGTGSNNNAGGSTSLALTVPSATQVNDVIIAGLTIRGGTGTTITTVPTGWTLLDQKRDSGTTLSQVVYWKLATSSDAGTAYTWQFTSNKASGVILSYSGVDTATPVETSLGQVNASSATVTAPSITTSTANDMLVGIFGTAVGTNSPPIYTATTLSTLEVNDAESTGGSASSRTATAAADGLQAAAGATGSKTVTTGTTTAVNVGHLLALKPNAGTSLSLTMPTGTVQNDVMVAAITVTGGSGVTITAPTGWTSIQNTNTSGNEIKVQSFWKAAGASEAGPYSFSWTGGQKASGAIISYSGVDPTTAVDVSNSVANASQTPDNYPSVTATISNDQYVAIAGVANNNTVTSVSPLTDEVYASSTGTSGTVTATRIADKALGSVGSTGSGQINLGAAAVNVTQSIALKPWLSQITQASHEWFSQPSVQAGTNTWISRPSAVESNPWSSIAYGNGTYVAVASGGTNRVMTSTDGKSWTARTSSNESNAWRSVTYGNGLFIAVADSGTNRVMTSQDGITWTGHASAVESNSWESVTYGNGTFVAVAHFGTNLVMTSTDGSSWTSHQSTNPEQNSWVSVTYGNGTFVAVSDNGNSSLNEVMTSPDGASWSYRASSTDANQWKSVTFANGTFVAVASSGTNRVMTSPDGKTWTGHASAGESNTWEAVTSGNGLFVSVADTGTNRVMTSPDGLSWTALSSAKESNSWIAVTYGNGMFSAVASGGTGLVMTSDGNAVPTASQWTQRTPFVDNQFNSITYGDGQFVAVNGQPVASNGVYTSPDGLTWTAHNSADSSVNWSAVVYGGGQYVAISNGGGEAMTSPDGATWTKRTGLSNHAFNSIAYGNGTYVAVDSQGLTGDVITSTDGITWTSRNAANTNAWNSVVYGNGLFVAVSSSGTGNRVMTSPDGITWTSRSSAADNAWVTVCYGNGMFVAVAQGSNQVMTSPDGSTWTSQTTPTSSSWNAVTFGNGLFVAVSNSVPNTAVITSPDGINWTSRTSVSGAWQAIAYGSGTFVAVSALTTGNGGIRNQIMTAPGIDASVGSSLAAQDTVVTNTTSDSLRLRMNLGVSYKNMSAGSQSFKLQYATRSGSVCGGSDTYYDVGTGSWATQATPNQYWVKMAYGAGLFVAVSNNTGSANKIMTSPDGVSWTSRASSDDTQQWSSIAYGNGRFVMTSSSSTATAVSTDGVNWSAGGAAVASQNWHVTYGNGLFVAVGTNTGVSQVMTSPDGTSWTSHSASAASSWMEVTYGNGLYVAVASSSSTSVMTSPDGSTWTSRTATSKQWQGLAYGNGIFVAAANNSSNANGLMTSYDGINWTLLTTNQATWDYVTYGNGLFLVTSSGQSIAISPDGVNWSYQTLPVSNTWYASAYGNGVYTSVVTAVASTSGAITMTPAVNWGGQLANNYGSISSSGSDPTQGASTIRYQDYIINNNFSSRIDTAIGEYAEYGFDLDMSKATYESTYCFRVVNSDGSTLTSYNTYPEITRCTVPPLARRMRHNDAFCGNTRRFFWSSASS